MIAFKAGEGRSFLTTAAAIFMTVNGQVHGMLPRRFLTREGVKLDFIKNDVMVVLNCTALPDRVREELFMASRDRLREGDVQQGIEDALEAFLGEHVELHRLNRQRRDEELRGRLADDKPLTDALKSVIDSSPELRGLFGQGEKLPVDDHPGDNPVEFTGLKFPTFFDLHKKAEPGQPAVVECPVGGVARVRFDTDASNDYFQRRNQPGTISIEPPGVFDRVYLRNGRAMLVLRCPEQTNIGDQTDVTVMVTDPSRKRPFQHRLRIAVVQAAERRDPKPNPKPKNSGALSLPKITEVHEADWAKENFGPESGLAMLSDVETGLVAKVNVDNRYLKASLARAKADDRDLVRKRFVYGLVLSGVSLWQECKDREDRDEMIRVASKATARVLLPTIDVLSALQASRLVHADD